MATTDVFLIEPHCDDWLLSMGLAGAHYLGAGIKVHVLSLSGGGSGGVLDDLAGTVVCGWHGIRHNPPAEGYAAPLEDDFYGLRIAESRAALGTLAAAITGAGAVEYHEGALPTGYGSLPDGVAQVQATIQEYVDTYANGTTFFHTMSPTADGHPDHRAAGQALRNLKNDPAYATLLSGSRFFTTRLQWSSPEAAAEGLTTFPVTASRKAEYDKAVRLAAKCYAAWQPPLAMAVGYHQVINQFYSNGLDSQANGTPSNAVVIENRWHD
jgi:LmbE family N-acetylglucosaminyl deacetylase